MNAAAPSEVSALRAARQRAGLSIEQLCVKAGISRVTLANAEKAPVLASERTLKAVAKALRVPIEELTGLAVQA